MMAALLFRYTCIKPLLECQTSSDIFYLLYIRKSPLFDKIFLAICRLLLLQLLSLNCSVIMSNLICFVKMSAVDIHDDGI